jgi:hypothetical protein
LIFGHRRRGGPVNLVSLGPKPQAQHAQLPPCLLDWRRCAPRATRRTDITPCVAFARRAVALRPLAAVQLATPPLASELRRTYSGYAASVFNSRPCRRHVFRVFSVRSDAASLSRGRAGAWSRAISAIWRRCRLHVLCLRPGAHLGFGVANCKSASYGA